MVPAMIRLRTKLLAAYVATIAPLFAVFGVWVVHVSSTALEEELGRSLAASAAIIASGYSSSTTAGRIARLEDDSAAMRDRLLKGLEASRLQAGLSRVRVVTPDLDTLVDTAGALPSSRQFDLETDRSEAEEAAATGGATSSVLFWDDDGTPFMRGYAPVDFEGEVVALVVVERPASYFARLRHLRAQTLGFGVLLLLATSLVSALISRRIVGPLTQLAEAARRVGEGDLKATLPALGNDEVGHLATALRQMQRDLAARDEDTRMMLAGIAHEVRNPIGGMELYLGVLEESLRDDAELGGHAARVRRELGYLTRVVEEFLAFSREQPLRMVRVTAEELVGAALASATRNGAAASIEVDVVPRDLALTCDVDAMRGVLINLLQNALQASPDGATVRVVARVPDGSPAERVLVVEDHGSGMAPDVLERAFRPFFTTREKGTGLGLALAKKIVTRHGGRISIDSAPGRGTRVTVVLPWDPAVPAANAVHAACETTQRPAADDCGEMIG